MLSRTLRANSGLSCITMLIWERRDSSVYERMSLPSIRILPSQGSWRRSSRLAIVDLPLPEGPTSTAFWPGFTSKLTFRSATRRGSYSKDTFSKRMCPANGGAGSESTPLEIQDGVDSLPAPPFAGHIRFENVSFEYEPRRVALRNVSFEVKPGQKAVLVGPSGSGKSTIASLLLRLHDPQEGRILIDGRDIRAYTIESLRSQISFVMQDSPLFALSVRDNIAFGATGRSSQEITEAARIANAHDFIMHLPQQYDTVLGERGATLSGGQRQRVAIARAAIRQAPIIILDEPTTGLDRKNESEVSAALDRLSDKSTTLLITHDLQPAQNADLVLFLSEGRIVERGTHHGLMALDREYAAMVHRQKLCNLHGEVACACNA